MIAGDMTAMGEGTVPSSNESPVLKRCKVRIRFRKEGVLRFLGHQDLMRCWDRLLRRAGLPLRHSEGFHPKPWISSPLALPLGLVGLDEILEFELTRPMTAEEIRQSIEAELVGGLSITSLSLHAPNEPTRVVCVEYRCDLPSAVCAETVQSRIESLRDSATALVERRHPDRPTRRIDLRPWILDADLDGRQLRFRVAVSPAGTARIEELLRLVGLEDLLDQGVLIARQRVDLA